jgi:hypothetical protein
MYLDIRSSSKAKRASLVCLPKVFIKRKPGGDRCLVPESSPVRWGTVSNRDQSNALSMATIVAFLFNITWANQEFRRRLTFS